MSGWMNWALNLAQTSEDPSVQNGAVIVNYAEDDLCGSSMNRLTYGVDDQPFRWERPAKYMWVEHAERQAIFTAAKYGKSTFGATMYCPWAACADCARAIVGAGIRKLVRFPMTGEADGWNESIAVGEEILEAAGVRIIEVDMDDYEIPEGLRLGQFRESF